MSLDDIAREGTSRPDFSAGGKPSNLIECADGFGLSVIAGAGAYCQPRVQFRRDYEGPYTAAEVGFPSARPEPWSEWREFAEDPDQPTGTVYSSVPVALIRALVDSHGGEVS